MRAPGEPLPRRRGFLGAAVFTLVGLIILCGLGTWQVKRLAWKERLIDTLQQRLAAEPAPLPERAHWPQLDQAQDEFRRVQFHAEIAGDRAALVYTAGSAFRRDVSGPGYWVFAPARLGDGSVVVVDRGFVPEGQQGRLPKSETSEDIVGVMRWPEAPNWFTPRGDPSKNLWFARDQQAIAAAKGWGAVAPFFVDQESPVPAGGLPRPGPLTVNLPNNHLQYAVTWYGLAAVLAAVFGIWAWARRTA